MIDLSPSAAATEPETMVGKFDVVGGDLPRGAGTYQDGVFRFRKGAEIGIEHLIGIQRQGVQTSHSVVKQFKDTVSMATALGPVGLVLGVAFAPAALPVGAVAAAIGASLGLLGGGQTTHAVLYLGFQDGRTVTALCDDALIEEIGKDARTILALAGRHRPNDVLPAARSRYGGRAPLPLSSPPPVSTPVELLPPPPTTDAGFSDHAGRALSAAGDAAAAATAAAGDVVSDALKWFRRSK